MSDLVSSHIDVIPSATRSTISTRYHTVTEAINRTFWNSISDTQHSCYVGSYGRGTAISTGDIDILVELPRTEYDHFGAYRGNSQSRLLQVVRDALKTAYPRSKVSADGQVVKINFSDGMYFEILPAFPKVDYWGNLTGGYDYPDTNMGGNWRSTDPKAEQKAVKGKNEGSNRLYNATCRHFRYVRNNYYSSYHLSGIVIDSFVYAAIGNWRYVDSGVESKAASGDYEKVLLDYFNNHSFLGSLSLSAPGSNQVVDTTSSVDCLRKVLTRIAM